MVWNRTFARHLKVTNFKSPVWDMWVSTSCQFAEDCHNEDRSINICQIVFKCLMTRYLDMKTRGRHYLATAEYENCLKSEGLVLASV